MRKRFRSSLRLTLAQAHAHFRVSVALVCPAPHPPMPPPRLSGTLSEEGEREQPRKKVI